MKKFRKILAKKLTKWTFFISSLEKGQNLSAKFEKREEHFCEKYFDDMRFNRFLQIVRENICVSKDFHKNICFPESFSKICTIQEQIGVFAKT
jgi:hypothetical protein